MEVMQDSEETYFEIRDSGNFIRMETIQLSHPDGSDWDVKWIDTVISAKAGAFSGNYTGSLIIDDFYNLEQQLSKLDKTLSGKAVLRDLEGYLELEIVGDGIGHFEVSVKMTDQPGIYQNQLVFSLQIDQSFIPEMVRQLDAIYRRFSIN